MVNNFATTQFGTADTQHTSATARLGGASRHVFVNARGRCAEHILGVISSAVTRLSLLLFLLLSVKQPFFILVFGLDQECHELAL